MTLQSWNYALTVFTWITVVLGLLTGGGALIINRYTSAAQERRMAATEAQLAEANARASEALLQAELAQARTEEAKEGAEATRKEAAMALAKAAAANERAAKLEVEAGEQRERAANAERLLLELRERIRDRHIEPEQRGALKAALTGIQGEIRIQCVGGNPEPCLYAHQLSEALVYAGWKVDFSEPNRGVMFVGSSPRGVILRSRSPTDPVGIALQRALLKVQIKAPVAVVPELDVDLELLVGSKP